MTDAALEDRLREHAKSFDGLLSLIPAKLYYGKDTSDQWKKKKQTKEQAAAAMKAKLDPNSVKSAKDIMDERARKRKLDEVGDDETDDGHDEGTPISGTIVADAKSKKQKTDNRNTKKQSQIDNNSSKRSTNEDSKKDKLERKQLQQERKKEKLAKKANITKSRVIQQSDEVNDSKAYNEQNDAGMDDEARAAAEMEAIEIDGLVEESNNVRSSKSQSGSPQSSVFDSPAGPSANTSTSSSIPPASIPKHIKLPANQDAMRARLAARIEALRAARKADGLNGQPARNRQELMESRRRKEEQRRAHKKELRLKARAEEEARRTEALNSARNSPASPMISNGSENNFSFGRVAFADGLHLNDNLTSFRDVPKHKGPQDAATALAANEKKRLRIAGLDEEKRADIEEKELWLAAKKRAHGEKVRDDTSLLKKTLKRKEKAKKKSEKEWNERKEGIAKGQAMRQKKREENLRKRKEEKGKGKGKSKSGPSKKGKPKSRPGFEGSFSSGKRR